MTMTLTERIAAIESHLEIIGQEAEHEYQAALAVVHAELAKLEAAVLNKVAQIKNDVKNAADKV